MSDRNNRMSRTDAELEALGEGVQNVRKKKPKPKPKPKPKEKRGLGRSLEKETARRQAAAARTRLEAARKTGNTAMAAKLEARLAELQKIIGK